MPAAVASPRPRTSAQVEAARRNGARSRGPVTPEGKRRSSANALKHGRSALHHLILEGEDPDELEGLTARLLGEIGAEGELEARLVRRLAVAFWKGERAERMEVALLDGAPGVKPPTRGGTWEEADPAETFDVKRFNAVRGHQAAQGREIGRCLKELRQLRREPLVEEDEPEAMGAQNKPGDPGPEPVLAANDDGPRHGTTTQTAPEEKTRNETELSVVVDPGAGLGDPALVLGSRVFAAAWNGADWRLQAVREDSAPGGGATVGIGTGQVASGARTSLP
jgi:hypothetical protein